MISESTYKFDLPEHQKSIIKVIGVGGGGSNAVNHMFNQGIRDVEFVVCNTDAQSLNNSPVPNKLQIGINLTGGLGAGANPEKGKDAAIESKEEIRALLEDNTKMLFITAGMGGGTGTGAAPVIARVAKDMDILTVGIVTVPFAFEGKKKMYQANEGIKELKESCDTVLVILNDMLREIYGNLPISDAFAEADAVLTTAAKGIAEIITVPGYVNVDFEDVKTVMSGAGAAVMGSAVTEGDNRARKAAEQAISSPLLNSRDIHGAQRILLSIISGDQAELQMDELSEITEFIHEMAGEEAEMIFGHGVDPALGQSIRVTVITTGFNQDEIKPGFILDKKVYDLEKDNQTDLFDASKVNIHNGFETKEPELKEEKEPEESSEKEELQEMDDNVKSNDDAFERGYLFESFPPEEKDSNPEVIEDLKEESKVLDNKENEEVIDKEDDIELKRKKELLKAQAQERVNKFRGTNSPDLDLGEFKEKLDVPAYLRKNVTLSNNPHSSQSDISRFNLNDDNQILGNNKFLHDNVD